MGTKWFHFFAAAALVLLLLCCFGHYRATILLFFFFALHSLLFSLFIAVFCFAFLPFVFRVFFFSVSFCSLPLERQLQPIAWNALAGTSFDDRNFKVTDFATSIYADSLFPYARVPRPIASSFVFFISFRCTLKMAQPFGVCVCVWVLFPFFSFFLFCTTKRMTSITVREPGKAATVP